MRFSKDVKLCAGGAALYFKHLEWDTEFFGRDSFILDAAKSRIKPCGEIIGLFDKTFKDRFVTIKLDSACGKGILDFMQKLGFKYIETEITLKYCSMPARGGKRAKPAGRIKILELKENKGLPYKELGSSFDKTRFHSDANIPTRKADELWIKYIKNYKITPLQRMFIARVGEKAAGTILVSEDKKKKEATLFFVAVLNDFRNMGIGSRLIKYAAGKYSGVEIFTETQISNKAALNFYIRNGFSEIKNVKTILHRW